MTIKSRLPKVREAAKQTVLCLNKSSFESVYGLRSLSDPSVNYQVRLQWNSQGKLEDIPYSQVSCECHKANGVGEVQPDCEGNSDSSYRNSTVCYHSLAALVKKAEDKSQSLSLFDSFHDAVRYLNFGGKLVKVISAQGKGSCWAVVSQRKPSDLPGDGGVDKIEFELSPEEQRKLDQEMKRRQRVEAHLLNTFDNIKELSRGRLISLEEKEARQQAARKRYQRRVEMMRGKVEEGIE